MVVIFTPYIVSLFFVFFTGACIGSFLNLAIYRVPLGLSVVKPRSHCPSCKKNIPFIGLVPVFGFFFLLGKCYFCKKRISWQYPLVEFLTAILTLLLYIRFFSELTFLNVFYSNAFHIEKIVPFLVSLWLLYTGIVLSAIDLKYRILPDIITIPGTFIGVLLSTFNPKIGFLTSFIGIVVGFGGLFLVTKLYELIRKKQGMGFGDVKYLGFIGACIGAVGVFYTLLIASIIGSVVGIIYGIATKKGLSVSIPFGPFLAIAALFVYTFLC